MTLNNLQKYQLVKAAASEEIYRNPMQISDVDTAQKLLSYGALGALPGLAYSAMVDPRKVKDRKARPVSARASRALRNALLTAVPTVGASVLGDDDLRFKFISPLVGRVLTNTIYPVSYDPLPKKLEPAMKNKALALKAIMEDKPMWGYKDPKLSGLTHGHFVRGTDDIARRTLFRLGMGMDIPKSELDEAGLIPRGKNQYDFNPDTVAGSNGISDIRAGVIDSVTDQLRSKDLNTIDSLDTAIAKTKRTGAEYFPGTYHQHTMGNYVPIIKDKKYDEYGNMDAKLRIYDPWDFGIGNSGDKKDQDLEANKSFSLENIYKKLKDPKYRNSILPEDDSTPADNKPNKESESYISNLARHIMSKFMRPAVIKTQIPIHISKEDMQSRIYSGNET